MSDIRRQGEYLLKAGSDEDGSLTGLQLHPDDSDDDE